MTHSIPKVSSHLVTPKLELDPIEKKTDLSNEKVEQVRSQHLTPSSTTPSFDPLLVNLKKLIDQKVDTEKKYQTLYQIIQCDFNDVEQKYVYELLEKEFRKIEFTSSSQTWIIKANLLDILDAFLEKYPTYSPLLIQPPVAETEWKPETVPLVPYAKIKSATQKLQKLEKGQKPQTKVELQKVLEESVVGEYTSTAKTIQKLTRRHLIGASLLNTFYRILTRILGVFYTRSPLMGTALDQISHFSQKMGIQSFEVLAKKTKGVDGKNVEQFYYRGPRYLFGHSIYDYRTINDWFKRDLTAQAREDYLAQAFHKETKINTRYGDSNGVSRIVISNSDSRLRFAAIQPGHLEDAQELTGKVLNKEAEKQAKVKHDDPAYYAEKYKFNVKNLLGRETQDTMLPRLLSSQDHKDFSQNIDKLQKQRLKSPQSRATSRLKKTVLKQKAAQRVLKQAQHELLGGIYRAFDQEGAVQVIQRLAPADIHNYVAPLNGTPLSHQEAASFLKQRLMERKEYMLKTHATLSVKEKQAFDEEKTVLEQLEKVFALQEILLERPSQATIDIYGTNASVSTSAIQNQSSILAQNDRKVMLYKHEDGSFSLHVFIGATGVNRVDVDPLTSAKKQGERQGDMQFGADLYQAQGQFEAAGDATTKDGLQKLRTGERKGSFPINGSTVISYYLPSDFSVLDKLQKFQEQASYGAGMQQATVEVQAKMGDPLLVKTEVALLDALEKAFSQQFTSQQSVQDIMDFIATLTESNKGNLTAQHLSSFQALAENSPRTLAEAQLKERFQALLQKRLDVINEQNRLTSHYQLNEQDIQELEKLDTNFLSLSLL